MRFDIPGVLSRFAWAGYTLAAVLLYILGAGIAQHLGAPLQVGDFTLGLGWIAGLVFFTFFLHRMFDVHRAAANLGRRFFGFMPWRTGMLTGALVAATIAAAAALALTQRGAVSAGVFTLMLLAIAGSCLFTLPPARWAESGYGELLLSVMVGGGIPAFGFMLQFGDYHRYLAMVGFPIAALHLAMMIAVGLPGYAGQQKYEQKTLLTLMGWENAMAAHNLLILGAFFVIAAAAFFNFPRFAAYPVLLALPLGVLEIYYMLRISDGLRPNWNALAVSSVALFALPAYLFTLAFWTN